MAKKLTKTQQKRLFRDMQSKLLKLYNQGIYGDPQVFTISTKDFIEINKILTKYQKKL